jgi:DnaJ-class molecular chaperone
MASRDYYEVLAISRSASPEDVRTAYRRLARQYHPDVNKAPDAVKKFAEVQKAYEVLSEPAKRELYDQFGEAAFEPGGPGGGGSSGGSGRSGPGGGGGGGGGGRGRTPWSNVGGGGGRGTTGGGGFDYDQDDIGSVFESIFGGGRSSSSGSGGSGGGGGGRGSRRAGPSRFEDEDEPEPTVHDVRIDFVTSVRGGTHGVTVQTPNGQRTIDVTIPAGIDDGTKMRVRGSLKGMGAGSEDLLLRVHVLPHELWRRGEHEHTGKGLDIYLDLPLTFAESALGATIDVPTPRGMVALRVPGGTWSGKKLRARGMGIKTEDGRQGDVVVVVGIVAPNVASMDDAERAMLVKVSEAGGSPRMGASWGIA